MRMYQDTYYMLNESQQKPKPTRQRTSTHKKRQYETNDVQLEIECGGLVGRGPEFFSGYIVSERLGKVMNLISLKLSQFVFPNFPATLTVGMI